MHSRLLPTISPPLGKRCPDSHDSGRRGPRWGGIKVLSVKVGREDPGRKEGGQPASRASRSGPRRALHQHSTASNPKKIRRASRRIYNQRAGACRTPSDPFSGRPTTSWHSQFQESSAGSSAEEKRIEAREVLLVAAISPNGLLFRAASPLGSRCAPTAKGQSRS